MATCTIAQAKEEIKNAVRAYLSKSSEGKYRMRERDRLPIYLEGPPGVGKTQIAQEAAEELGIGFVHFSLTHHTRTTVLGLPVLDDVGVEHKEKYTHYTMSELIAAVYERVEEGNREGILLLDEFPCMAESIMPIMLEFLQSKNIGRYKLPDGWVIIACGNPPKFNRSARTFDATVLDRLRRIEIHHSTKDFLEYAKKRKIHRAIICYLELYPANSFRCEYHDGTYELITARGWENLSETMKAYENLGIPVSFETISSYVKCEEVARDFAGFLAHFAAETAGDDREFEKVLAGDFNAELITSFAKAGLRSCLKRLEYVVQYLLKDTENIYDNTEEQRLLAEGYDHVLTFSKLIDPSCLLHGKIFRQYRENEDLLNAMAHFPQPEFTECCRKEYFSKPGSQNKIPDFLEAV